VRRRQRRAPSTDDDDTDDDDAADTDDDGAAAGDDGGGGAKEGSSAVSHLCARSGSPCLKQCVHGAPIRIRRGACRARGRPMRHAAFHDANQAAVAEIPLRFSSFHL
jgi:hypothetical protein